MRVLSSYTAEGKTHHARPGARAHSTPSASTGDEVVAARSRRGPGGRDLRASSATRDPRANSALQGTRGIITRAAQRPRAAPAACGCEGCGGYGRAASRRPAPPTRGQRHIAHALPPWPMRAASALLSAAAPAQRRTVLDDHIFSAVAKETPSEGLVANAASPAAREREVSQGGGRVRCAAAGGVHCAHHGASAVLLYVGTAVWARPAASQPSWAQRPPRAHPSGDCCTQIPTALHLPLVLAQEAHDRPLTVIVVPNAKRALRAVYALEIEPLGPLLILLSLRYLRRNRVKCP